MFFGIGTDNEPHLIQETTGSQTARMRIDLSVDLTGEVKIFDVAQNHENGHIDVAVALTDSAGVDALYLSRDNSAADLSWTGLADLSEFTAVERATIDDLTAHITYADPS